MKSEVIELKTGQTTVIKFKGLSSSGYEWVVNDKEQHVLQIQKKYYLPVEAHDSINSVSAEEQFHIKALATGQAALIFQLKRNGVADKSAGSVKNYIINVTA